MAKQKTRRAQPRNVSHYCQRAWPCLSHKKTEGNLASNWKKFKRSWDNYAIVARLNRFEDEFKTATFLSCIGEDAMEIFEGLDFASEEDRTKFDIVVTKFKELCLGETNETYENSFSTADKRMKTKQSTNT